MTLKVYLLDTRSAISAAAHAQPINTNPINHQYQLLPPPPPPTTLTTTTMPTTHAHQRHHLSPPHPIPQPPPPPSHSTTTTMHRHDRHVKPSRHDTNARPSRHHHTFPPPPPLFTTTTTFHHHDTSKHDRHAKRQRCPHAPQMPRHEANTQNTTRRHDHHHNHHTLRVKRDRHGKATPPTPRHDENADVRPERVEHRASVPGHTKDGQGRARRGQTAGRTRYARIFIYFINDYLTGSIPAPSPPFQNTKNTKNAPVWARFSCPGSPPPTPPPTSSRAHKTRPYGRVLRVCLLFSPKTQETRPGGRVSRSQCPPLPQTSTTRRFGVFLVVDAFLPPPPTHNLRKRAQRLVFGRLTSPCQPPSPTTPENEPSRSFSGGIYFLPSSSLSFFLPFSFPLHCRYLMYFLNILLYFFNIQCTNMYNNIIF